MPSMSLSTIRGLVCMKTHPSFASKAPKNLSPEYFSLSSQGRSPDIR